MPHRVRTDTTGPVARITLDDPDRLNAVDAEMLDALADAVGRLGADPAVRAIAVAGAGRGFCAGANLGGGADEGADEVASRVDTSTLDAAVRAVRAIVDCPVPTVALVHGVAAGVGVSVALACDYVLVSDVGSFVLAFARIGLMPDGGATALVAASIGRARAMRMALTGEKVDGATAADWGLASECVAAAAFDERATALLDQLAASAPEAARLTAAAVNAASLDLEPAFEREDSGQTRLLGTDDFREGVAAFLDKRPARFGGSRP